MYFNVTLRLIFQNRVTYTMLFLVHFIVHLAITNAITGLEKYLTMHDLHTQEMHIEETEQHNR